MYLAGDRRDKIVTIRLSEGGNNGGRLAEETPGPVETRP